MADVTPQVAKKKEVRIIGVIPEYPLSSDNLKLNRAQAALASSKGGFVLEAYFPRSYSVRFGVKYPHEV